MCVCMCVHAVHVLKLRIYKIVGLPVPENVQASLEFVNKFPVITVTWEVSI